MTQPEAFRYAEKFENDGGSVSYTFPAVLEWQPSQKLRQLLVPVAGADYPFDHFGAAPWPKAEGIETVRLELSGASASAVE